MVVSDPSQSDSGTPQADRTACVALVPLVATPARPGGLSWRWSPDASFVAQLIACARGAPQTRRMRRASAADAQAAYRTPQARANPVGGLTRQVI